MLMLRFFSYECKNEHVFEELVKDEEKHEKYLCPVCNEVGKYVLSPTRFKMDGTNPNNARAWDRWGKDRLKQIKHEEKYNPSDS